MNTNTQTRSFSFFSLSTIAHAGLVLATFALPAMQENHELIQMEILASAPAPVSPVVAATPAPEKALEAKPEAAAPAPAPSPAPAVVAAPAKPAASKAPKVATALPKASAPAKAAPAPAPVKALDTQEESPVVVAPAVEAPAEPEPQAQLKEEDIAEDLDKIDEEQNAKVAAVSQEELKNHEAQVLAVQKKTQIESANLAKENADKRKAERDALAAANAAKAAQQAEAAREAQATAAAALAANQASAGNGNGDSIRDLKDLKQVPGNKTPQYDNEDRLKGRAGEVAFLAFVSREGAMTQFKMLKSSGHRELDAKTLKAIRNWKFYPGQEGWVEIPMKWDLKGGVQEIPATLRRKVSQN